MKVTVKMNKKFFEENRLLTQKCLLKTADALKTDLTKSQTMPFDTGALQNRSGFVDDSNIFNFVVSVVYDTPYSRRQYYHPEFNFQKDKNPNAGGLWFEPYLSGNKKNFVRDTFAKFLERGRR